MEKLQLSLRHHRDRQRFLEEERRRLERLSVLEAKCHSAKNWLVLIIAGFALAQLAFVTLHTWNPGPEAEAEVSASTVAGQDSDRE